MAPHVLVMLLMQLFKTILVYITTKVRDGVTSIALRGVSNSKVDLIYGLSDVRAKVLFWYAGIIQSVAVPD
jgi:hypothetical protein